LTFFIPGRDTCRIISASRGTAVKNPDSYRLHPFVARLQNRLISVRDRFNPNDRRGAFVPAVMPGEFPERTLFS